MRLDEVSLSESLPLQAWNLALVAISDGGRCAIIIRIPSRLSPLSRHCYSSHRLEFIYFHTKRTVFLLVSLVSGPRKRPRVPMDDPGGTNGTEDGSQEQRQRDAQFWYEDGTIYLTAGSVAFKVYRGPLVDHSPVFRDMLSLPQPPADASPSVQHPVVSLSDAPCDLRHLLRVLMPKKELM